MKMSIKKNQNLQIFQRVIEIFKRTRKRALLIRSQQVMEEPIEENDVPDEYGCTLMSLAANGNLDKLIILFNFNHTRRPSQYSGETGTTKDKFFELLDGNGNSAMLIACSKGHLNIVQFLFQQGAKADIRQPNKEGVTPMTSACHNGHIHIVQYLFQNGASVRQTTNKGSTPMLIACREGHLNIVQFLFQNGARADVRRPDKEGVTPMLSACFGGYMKIILFLFQNGARGDVEKVSCDGTSPMLVSCQEGEIFYFLLFPSLFFASIDSLFRLFSFLYTCT